MGNTPGNEPGENTIPSGEALTDGQRSPNALRASHGTAQVVADTAGSLTEPTIEVQRQNLLDELNKLADEADKAIRKPLKLYKGNDGTAVTEDMVLTSFLKPLFIMRQDFEKEVKTSSDFREMYPRYKEAIEKYKKAALGYIETTKNGKTEALAVHELLAMARSMDVYMNVMAMKDGQFQNTEIIEVFQGVIMRPQPDKDGKIDSTATQKHAESIQWIKKNIGPAFENTAVGPQASMNLYWTMMRLMSYNEKIDIALDFAKTRSKETVKTFLKEGGKMGVFGINEMKEVMKKVNIEFDSKDEEREVIAAWKAQEEYQKIAVQAMPYGSVNGAGRSLTLGGIAFFFAQLAAGTTLVANLAVGVLKAGAWKSPAALAKLVTSIHVAGPAALLVAAHQYKSDTPLAETFGIKDEKIDKENAHRALSEEFRGGESWERWDNFFRHGDFAGAKVFQDFIMARDKKTEVSGLEAKDFMKYLEEQSRAEKPKRAEAHYKELIDSFEKIADKKTGRFAKIFDVLKIGGGAEAKTTYEGVIDEIRNAKY